MSFLESKTTSTVVSATLVTLALMAWVKVTDSPLPEALPARAEGAVPDAPIASLEVDGDGGAAGIEAAFAERSSGRSVQVRGVVKRVLPDEREGGQRQRLMIELTNGRSLLVIHELDVAARVPAALGDSLEVCGSYVWNNRGGHVQATCRDPQGLGGWIRHADSDYR